MCFYFQLKKTKGRVKNTSIAGEGGMGGVAKEHLAPPSPAMDAPRLHCRRSGYCCPRSRQVVFFRSSLICRPSTAFSSASFIRSRHLSTRHAAQGPGVEARSAEPPVTCAAGRWRTDMGQRRDLRASRKDRELPERRAWEGRPRGNAVSKREPSHQQARALPMPAVRPLFLTLHKGNVVSDGEPCFARC